MFRNTCIMIFASDGLKGARPIKVIATKRDRTYKIFANGNKGLLKSSGYYVDTLSGNYAVVKAGAFESKDHSRTSSSTILFHEFTHYLASNVSSMNLPYWYSEGLADFLSATQFPDNNTINYGLPLQYHLHNIQTMPWMSMEKLLKATHISHKKRRDRYRIYSQGWLLVHYLKTEPGQGPVLTQFLNLLANGTDIDQAFAQSFNMSYQELDKVLRRYARSKYFSYAKIPLKQSLSTANFTSKKLQPEEILFELGEFMLNSMNAQEEARVFFERVLEINPEYANAIAGIANIEMFDDLAKAKKLAEQAKSLDATSSWVSTVSGHVYSRFSRAAEDETDRIKYWNKAVRNFNHAINSDGINVEAISSAADLYFSAGRFDKARNLLEIAYEFAPTNYSLRRQLISVYSALGETQLMDKIVTQVETNHHMSDAALAAFENWISKIKAQSPSNNTDSGSSD